ncbi:hypothetical protein G8770_19615 [Aestuariicella hydrocarbonica]|uniref:HTH luxR-type domain-containing protein n=1 Tax=Pseudomaricurvus hydrocarbonicus TaxID=1470433 RepID=A0A9E5MNY6_9GAMM|nr:helix-turn-helix transcriptional regulator [Aestuariicella hydrocarbonica]NHO67760.1 hypothetical protein [Aestuariicella hydrocarbonica]
MSQSLLPSQAFITAMAQATRSLNSEDFPQAILDLINLITPVDSLAVVGFPCDSLPVLFADITGTNVEPEKKGDLTNYINGAYLLDPFYEASQEFIPSGLYRLNEVAPDDFHESEYFRLYYRFSSLVDEVGFLLAVKDAGYLHLSLARIESFDEAEVDALRRLTPWLLAMLEQQWQGALLQKPEQGVSLHKQLSEALRNFGSSMLTERECEVARLLLHGHSSKSMAEKLKISMETIKVHRRNLYNKLDISSQSELFSLFLSSISLAGRVPGSDPLSAYHAPPTD